MSLTRCARIVILVMAVAVVGAARAQAQTCGFSISPMSFGPDIDTLSSSAVDTTATLSYNCSNGTPSDRVLICVELGEGSVNPSGNARRMSGGSSYLLYQLYANSERTIIWGSAGTGYPPVSIAVTLDGNGSVSNNLAIYGRVFGGQSTAEATTYTSDFTGNEVDIRYRVTNNDDCSAGSGSSGGAVSFTVSGTVAPKCVVSTAPVNFGSHSALISNIDAVGSVSVTCTPATTYAIRLDGGHAAAEPTARKMFKGSDTITYGLYQNPQRDQPWGDTVGAAAPGTGSGLPQSHTVYGRVGSQPTPPPGTYTDTVVVIVDY
jgi:spore coat protein U-like protein